VWSQWISSTQTAVSVAASTVPASLGSITRIGAGDRPEVAVDDYDNGLAVWQSAIGISGNASKVYAQES